MRILWFDDPVPRSLPSDQWRQPSNLDAWWIGIACAVAFLGAWLVAPLVLGGA